MENHRAGSQQNSEEGDTFEADERDMFEASRGEEEPEDALFVDANAENQVGTEVAISSEHEERVTESTEESTAEGRGNVISSDNMQYCMENTGMKVSTPRPTEDEAESSSGDSSRIPTYVNSADWQMSAERETVESDQCAEDNKDPQSSSIDFGSLKHDSAATDSLIAEVLEAESEELGKGDVTTSGRSEIEGERLVIVIDAGKEQEENNQAEIEDVKKNSSGRESTREINEQGTQLNVESIIENIAEEVEFSRKANTYNKIENFNEGERENGIHALIKIEETADESKEGDESKKEQNVLEFQQNVVVEHTSLNKYSRNEGTCRTETGNEKRLKLSEIAASLKVVRNRASSTSPVNKHLTKGKTGNEQCVNVKIKRSETNEPTQKKEIRNRSLGRREESRTREPMEHNLTTPSKHFERKADISRTNRSRAVHSTEATKGHSTYGHTMCGESDLSMFKIKKQVKHLSKKCDEKLQFNNEGKISDVSEHSVDKTDAEKEREENENIAIEEKEEELETNAEGVYKSTNVEQLEPPVNDEHKILEDVGLTCEVCLANYDGIINVNESVSVEEIELSEDNCEILTRISSQYEIANRMFQMPDVLETTTGQRLENHEDTSVKDDLLDYAESWETEPATADCISEEQLFANEENTTNMITEEVQEIMDMVGEQIENDDSKFEEEEHVETFVQEKIAFAIGKENIEHNIAGSTKREVGYASRSSDNVARERQETTANGDLCATASEIENLTIKVLESMKEYELKSGDCGVVKSDDNIMSLLDEDTGKVKEYGDEERDLKAEINAALDQICNSEPVPEREEPATTKESHENKEFSSQERRLQEYKTKELQTLELGTIYGSVIDSDLESTRKTLQNDENGLEGSKEIEEENKEPESATEVEGTPEERSILEDRNNLLVSSNYTVNENDATNSEMPIGDAEEVKRTTFVDDILHTLNVEKKSEIDIETLDYLFQKSKKRKESMSPIEREDEESRLSILEDTSTDIQQDNLVAGDKQGGCGDESRNTRTPYQYAGLEMQDSDSLCNISDDASIEISVEHDKVDDECYGRLETASQQFELLADDTDSGYFISEDVSVDSALFCLADLDKGVGDYKRESEEPAVGSNRVDTESSGSPSSTSTESGRSDEEENRTDTPVITESGSFESDSGCTDSEMELGLHESRRNVMQDKSFRDSGDSFISTLHGENQSSDTRSVCHIPFGEELLGLPLAVEAEINQREADMSQVGSQEIEDVSLDKHEGTKPEFDDVVIGKKEDRNGDKVSHEINLSLGKEVREKDSNERIESDEIPIRGNKGENQEHVRIEHSEQDNQNGMVELNRFSETAEYILEEEQEMLLQGYTEAEVSYVEFNIECIKAPCDFQECVQNTDGSMSTNNTASAIEMIDNPELISAERAISCDFSANFPSSSQLDGLYSDYDPDLEELRCWANSADVLREECMRCVATSTTAKSASDHMHRDELSKRHRHAKETVNRTRSRSAGNQVEGPAMPVFVVENLTDALEKYTSKEAVKSGENEKSEMVDELFVPQREEEVIVQRAETEMHSEMFSPSSVGRSISTELLKEPSPPGKPTSDHTLETPVYGSQPDPCLSSSAKSSRRSSETSLLKGQISAVNLTDESVRQIRTNSKVFAPDSNCCQAKDDRDGADSVTNDWHTGSTAETGNDYEKVAVKYPDSRDDEAPGNFLEFLLGEHMPLHDNSSEPLQNDVAAELPGDISEIPVVPAEDEYDRTPTSDAFYSQQQTKSEHTMPLTTAKMPDATKRNTISVVRRTAHKSTSPNPQSRRKKSPKRENTKRPMLKKIGKYIFCLNPEED